MIPLLSLWLEDLAVALDRVPLPEALAEDRSESVAAAQRACVSLAASLREAGSNFEATLRRKA